MKKLSALLLSLLLLLTACGTPATPGDAVTLPTPNDEILVEEGLRAEDLPEVCRLWFDLAETSGAADKNSKLPLASRADEGACDYLAVRLPDGTYTDLIQEGQLADEGVTLDGFSGGRAKQEGSYGQLAWNGELYHAFTVSAADCTLPNLTAPDGGILRLNISGDCTVDGGGTTLLGAAEQKAEFILSGGTAHLAGGLAEGSTVEGGAGVFSAQSFSGAAVNDYGAVLWDGADGSAYRGVYGAGYYPTDYSPDWAGTVPGAVWDALTVAGPYENDWFAGTLTLENAHAPELLPWGGAHLRVLGENTVDGTLGGTGLLFTGGGSLTAGELNVWAWGSVRAPLLAVRDGTNVRCGALHMGSNAEEKGTLLVESGDLTVDGEFWLQNAALTVTGGELTLAGGASIDRGEVRISGGTVTFGHGLWLGEGDIVITGGTVIVPGGEAGLTAENGKVTISGGAVREP